MIFSIILKSLLGFSIFMSGMKLMELALFRLGGPQLLHMLERSTRTPLHGLALGTVSSAFLQSSTAVTVLSIGFVNSKLLPFSRTLGIILGTNIGTCLTTELISLNIHSIAKPLMLISVIIWGCTMLVIEYKLLPKLSYWRGHEIVRSVAIVLFGFGALLFGLTVMQSIGPNLQQTELFHWFLSQASTSLWWGVISGAVLTAFIHSGAAVIGIIMGFAAIGAMPIELCIAIVLGSNIGTCVTAIVASIGSSKGGRYVAISHLLLNVFGALFFFPFISQLSSIVIAMTSSISVQIAHAQTIFNIVCSLLVLPICYLSWFKRLDE